MAAEVAPAFASLALATRLAECCFSLANAPRSAMTFGRLFQQVKKDLEYAQICRSEADKILERQPPFIHKWIIASIQGAKEALTNLERYLRGTMSPKTGYSKMELSSLDATSFMFIIQDKGRLVDEERALKYAHTSLLTAINALHMVLLRPQSSFHDASADWK